MNIKKRVILVTLLVISFILLLVIFIARGRLASDYVSVTINLPQKINAQRFDITLGGKVYDEYITTNEAIKFSIKVNKIVKIKLMGYEDVEFKSQRGVDKNIDMIPLDNNVKVVFKFQNIHLHGVTFSVNGQEYINSGHSQTDIHLQLKSGFYDFDCHKEGYIFYDTDDIEIGVLDTIEIYAVKDKYVLYVSPVDEDGNLLHEVSFSVKDLTVAQNGKYFIELDGNETGEITATHDNYIFNKASYSKHDNNITLIGKKRKYLLTVKAISSGGDILTDINFISFSAELSAALTQGEFYAYLPFDASGIIGILDDENRFSNNILSYSDKVNELVFIENKKNNITIEIINKTFFNITDEDVKILIGDRVVNYSTIGNTCYFSAYGEITKIDVYINNNKHTITEINEEGNYVIFY